MGSCSKLDSGIINSRSVKKDSSSSDIIKITNTTNETTTEHLFDSEKDNSKKSINDDIDTPTKEPVLSKPPDPLPDLQLQSNISNISAPVQRQRKPFEGSVTITFVSIFVLGFLGVVVFYIWKRSTESGGRNSATFQYSVLNTFDNDPEDELIDHLRVGDDFIVTNESSDDDVELLGVPG